ncbi:YggT family protein [Chlamydiifrater phoenicopteri]|uniref:YggT family protein n=1 Tax=Chlamydiifrater phoenicopteri TaxID=2681469 RepID=UPI001BCE6DFB|nr:YggT family protein [Chlamydiifrater phoenicopteri]
MISYFVRTFVNVYSFLILIYIFASWFPEWQRTRWYTVIFRLVSPYLKIFKRFIPTIGFIDISPMVALVCLEVLPIVILKIVYFFVEKFFQAPWILQYI